MSARPLAVRLPVGPVVEWIESRYQHDEDDYHYDETARRVVLRNARIAELCEVERTTWVVYKREGIPFIAADAIACRLGLHPSLLWPEGYRQPIDPIECVHPERRGVARKLMKAGRPFDHLDGPPVRRAG